MVTAKAFRKAFAEQWHHDLADNEQALLAAYPDPTDWTAYMLKGTKRQDALLNRVARTLGLSMATGRFHLDAIYHKEESDILPDRPDIYPARFEVLIEHENGLYPEEEIYKMLLWRVPLKVLIFYDRTVFQKENNGRGQEWLIKKLAKMFEIGKAVDKRWPEAQTTKYLFLVGQAMRKGGVPHWRYWYVQNGRWPKHTDGLQRLQLDNEI